MYLASPSLMLVRDVANGSRHMRLTQYRVDGAATVDASMSAAVNHDL
jgi:hypothetical protein